MSFVRQPLSRWHQDVPGSRWFKADLHVHTIDDLPGGRVSMPAGVQGAPGDPAVLRNYAQVFLQGAVRRGVQVLGLTPHATRTGDGPDTSAVWHIVERWNSESDGDGVPFRQKIYAVFPGFEPNVNDGGSGVHLVFLFDPEIGRDRYLALFEAVMDARRPWDDGGVRLTPRDAKGVFHTIDERQQESRSTSTPWDYLALAPHLFLLPFMAKHRQAFFHASDACTIAADEDAANELDLSHRTTWVKLASPRIEALRQAFIASESRLRIAYERAADGVLSPLPEPPDPLQGARPWLRRVTVRGEAAFFGGRDAGKPREVTVDLSPDLTCIIGGSMTGKSTLLDGLRVYVDAEAPADDRLRKDVEARGRDRFLAGQPIIELDTPGGGADRPDKRWPAVFFTQNELQRLAQDPRAVEDILSRLVTDERETILKGNERLAALDLALTNQARALQELLDQRAEAEQQLTTAREAKKALDDFKHAGLEAMQASERLQGHVGRVLEQAGELRDQIRGVAVALGDAAIDADTDAALRECLKRMQAPTAGADIGVSYARAMESVKEAASAVSRWAAELARAHEIVRSAVVGDRQAVQRKLAAMGHGAEKLAEFQALSRRASMLSSYEAASAEVNAKVGKVQEVFQRDRSVRKGLVEEQRDAFDRVKQVVERQFRERIRIRRVDHGISEGLENLLLGLKQKGITQWWNGLDSPRRPSPEHLFEKLQTGELADLGVSSVVAERFQEVFSEAKRYELEALRSPDRYVLELRVGGDEYREADRLSGGKRVSLLLSLLLEAHDERPLVIDQPEDELDNRFLWETVLPALRRLKGRRQVIVATHNANIVVNGDADLVVQLEADAEHGRVAVAGAIEDPAVRRAIIETVDGGESAFELRKAKYGF